MRMVIIGAGAMGSFFAAKLAPVTDLWLLSRWQQHIAKIQQHGLGLVTLDGREQVIPVQATTNLADIPANVDLALIAVKSLDTRRASGLARHLLAADGVALSMQNGLGHLEPMKAVLAPSQIAQGVTSNGAMMMGPGVVRHAGIGPTYLATRPETAALLQMLADLLNQVGLETHLTPSLQSLQWGKLIINVGLNALTAILRVPTGYLCQADSAQKIVAAAVAEATQVAQAKQIRLPYADSQAEVEKVMRATAANRTSMLADILRGVPTEIEAINGIIVQEGYRLGIATPVNQMLVWLVKALEETRAARL